MNLQHLSIRARLRWWPVRWLGNHMTYDVYIERYRGGADFEREWIASFRDHRDAEAYKRTIGQEHL